MAGLEPDCHSLEGVCVARLTGGGFGGATLNLVRSTQADSFRAHVAAGYNKRYGRHLESWVCQVVDGAA